MNSTIKKDKDSLIELFENPKDYLSDMSKDEKNDYLDKTNYKAFLREKLSYQTKLIAYFEGSTG